MWMAPFSGEGNEGTGIILRDNKGEVIIVASRQHVQCLDALAQLMAIEEGVRLSLHWS
jgi:hypothetical protein